MAEYRVNYWAPTEYQFEIDADSEEEAKEEAIRLITEEMYEGDNLGFNSDEISSMTAYEL